MSQYGAPASGPWGPVAPPPEPVAAKPTRGPALGWVALGLGVLAIALAILNIVVPVVGVGALLVGAAGFILAIVALALRSRPRVLAVLGLLGSIAAGVTVFVTWVVLLTMAVSTVAGGIRLATIPPASTGEVVFEVTGTATDVTIGYAAGTSQRANADTKTVQHQSLPFTVGETIRLTGSDTVIVTATGAGSMRCRITVNGAVVVEHSGDGIVLCTAGVIS